jgi:hypothetical protein
VRCGAQNARRNKRLSGSEMIEWGMTASLLD